MNDWQIAVRSSTADADRVLRDTFRANLVPDATPKGGFYSVILGPTVPSRAGEHALSFLFVDGTPIVRSRSVLRTLRALATHLSSHADTNPPPGLLRLRSVAAVGDMGCLLLPLAVFSLFDFAHLERGLGRLGLRIVDQPWVHLDAVTAEVVVEAAPPLPLESLIRDLPGLRPTSEEHPTAGRFPLVAWAVTQPNGADEPTVAEVAAHGITLVSGSDPDSAQSNLERIAGMAHACKLIRLVEGSLEKTLTAIEDAVRRQARSW